MARTNTRDLTDAQWAILDDLIPKPERREDGRGRPWKDRRAVLNGVLWVLRTGAPWGDVPKRYPSYQNVSQTFPTVGPLWSYEGRARGTCTEPEDPWSP